MPDRPSDMVDFPYAIASLLDSGVGPVFYERATIGLDLPGWITKEEECQYVTWKLRPVVSQPSDADGMLQREKGWEWIYPSAYPDLERLFTAAKRDKLRSLPAGKGAVWACDPASPGLLDYIPRRSQYFRPDD